MRRLFVGVLFVAACSKSDAPKPEDKPPGPGPVKAPEQPADKPVAEAPPAKIKQATNAGDLGVIPIDSEIVLGVNVAQAQTTAFWKDFLAPGVMSDDVKAKLEDFKQKCQLDPMAAIASATLGLKGENDTRAAVIVAHGLDKAKALACADKLKADKDAKVEITQDGDATILKPKAGGPTLAVQFTSDTDAVIVVGSRATGAGVKSVLAGEGTLSKSAAFVDMFNRAETEKTLWFMVSGKHPQFKPLAMLGVKPSHVYGSVDASNGLDLVMRMRLASADMATQTATMFKSQLGPAAGMLKMDKLDVSSDGNDLKINIVVTQANLGGMITALKGAAGSMGGGAMGGPQ